MKIRDILRTKGGDIVTVSQSESLLEASRLLGDYGIGVLLVVDADGKPIGILSERDIVREFARVGPDCAATAVQAVMTEDLIVGLPDDDLSYVMNVMTQQRIRHLPILEDDQLVGLVSIGDVVKAHVTQTETEIRHLHSYITGGRPEMLPGSFMP
jgi:CBS domain-containing protein